jgi:hypothetical protein
VSVGIGTVAGVGVVALCIGKAMVQETLGALQTRQHLDATAEAVRRGISTSTVMIVVKTIRLLAVRTSKRHRSGAARGSEAMLGRGN